MATLETIFYQPHRPEVDSDHVAWVEATSKRKINELPQIVWRDQSPWREANLWALQNATDERKNIKTVWAAMKHIHAYAKWLENEEITWWHFPVRESERCLVRYRGSLKNAINNSEIAPSTAQQRMSAVIRFYRWLAVTGLVSPEWPMWRERQVGIQLKDQFGFERTVIRNSTDLAITNRKVLGSSLEDGLLPVPTKDIASLLEFSESHTTEELHLMLRLGFGTGMRYGTIADLKVKTVERAAPDASLPGYFRLAVGPGAHPPVHTKFGVTGQVLISVIDLEVLKFYIFSPRRLKRQAQAKIEHRDHIFLTRFGSLLGPQGNDTSRSLNVELGRLRTKGLAMGLNCFRNFKFHQSRCTFATLLARTAIRHGSVSFAIELVMKALLHKNESTTLKYIKFVEQNETMNELSDEFTLSFLGIKNDQP